MAAVIIFAIILPRALADPMGKLIRMILARFTKAELKGIIIGAIALLPLTIVLPAQPFAWIAGGCLARLAFTCAFALAADSRHVLHTERVVVAAV